LIAPGAVCSAMSAESPKNRVLVRPDLCRRRLRPSLTRTLFEKKKRRSTASMSISRSTTVVIAYLIATTKMIPREALAVQAAHRAPQSRLHASCPNCRSTIQSAPTLCKPSSPRNRSGSRSKGTANGETRRRHDAMAGGSPRATFAVPWPRPLSFPRIFLSSV
jgi:hypothetical protein